MKETIRNPNRLGCGKTLKTPFVVKGTAFTCRKKHEFLILKDALFVIDSSGMIEKVILPYESTYERVWLAAENKLELAKHEYLLPGMVDLHIHAPQWAQTGTALDIPLEDWLMTYTFPLEAKFSDIDYANQVYQDLVDQLLAAGTTTALYFATVHPAASYRLAEICNQKGQRGLVGKVVMDDTEMNPVYYRDQSAQNALEETERFIQKVQQLNETSRQGVYPVITPRFIPSCTDEALAGLGKLAQTYNVHIQSHCSESDWEHHYVRNRCGKNDAQALAGFGLLQDKAVMAHCNHLTDEDAQLFSQTGTAIAHCPISNAYFANGVLPACRFSKDFDVEIGLGSDLSGGFSKSIFDNIKQAVMASRMLEDGVDVNQNPTKRGVSNSRITLHEAFYFATAGGGESLSLPVGSLSEGFAWDALVIDTRAEGAKIPLFDSEENLDDIFQKIIYGTTPANIKQVWVQGALVHEQ